MNTLGLREQRDMLLELLREIPTADGHGNIEELLPCLSIGEQRDMLLEALTTIPHGPITQAFYECDTNMSPTLPILRQAGITLQGLDF